MHVQAASPAQHLHSVLSSTEHHQVVPQQVVLHVGPAGQLRKLLQLALSSLRDARDEPLCRRAGGGTTALTLPEYNLKWLHAFRLVAMALSGWALRYTLSISKLTS
jgi:hypothetical protein